MTRILIADDHALVRAGLQQFLRDDFPGSHVAEASCGQQALEMLREDGFDLLILDINLPDRSGLDILGQVRASHPGTRVLVLSGYPERQYAANVLKAGACGYVSKDAPPEELTRAVTQVLEGRRYASAALAGLLEAQPEPDRDRPLHAGLSGREFQIFCKLAVGQSVSDIASELSISVKTVSTYRTRVLEKMRFSSNADITSYAVRNGLVN